MIAVLQVSMIMTLILLQRAQTAHQASTLHQSRQNAMTVWLGMRTTTVIRPQNVPYAVRGTTLDWRLRAVTSAREVSMIMTLILPLHAQAVY